MNYRYFLYINTETIYFVLVFLLLQKKKKDDIIEKILTGVDKQHEKYQKDFLLAGYGLF